MIRILRDLWNDEERPIPMAYALMLALVAAAVLLGATAAGAAGLW